MIVSRFQWEETPLRKLNHTTRRFVCLLVLIYYSLIQGKRMGLLPLRHSVFGWSSRDVQGHSEDDCTLGFGLWQLYSDLN